LDGSRSTLAEEEMAAPMSFSSSVESTEIPNWRSIPKESENYKSYLVHRSDWSDAQYKESLQLYSDLMACTDGYVQTGIRSALNTLDHAYRLYGPRSVVCSYNGGKDAVVILHLLRAAHAKHYSTTGGTPLRPRAVYFNNPDEFSEVASFLHESVNMFDLDMIAFEDGVKFAAGLEILVQNNVLPASSIDRGGNGYSDCAVFPMAFVLGTRQSDPNAAGQDHFSPSSHWMPPFMRVNPILDWNYGHVWHFLRLFKLPYCSLYDQGYTSLGTVKDTLPCPALAVNRDGTGEDDRETMSSVPKFWPAYMLRDWDQERAGRVQKDTTKKASSSDPQPRDDSGLSASELTVVSNLRRERKLWNESIVLSVETTDDNQTINSLGTDKCSKGETKSVGMLVVGDEILKGMTMDSNTNVAAKALRQECIQLARVVVVSDDIDEIATEIRRLTNDVDVIITSGGVGPTHDDVTLRGVAEALDQDLVYHDEMATLLREKMKTGDAELTAAQTKMATLPSNAKLRYLSGIADDWPILQCRNIFVLPGVPEFFAKKIKHVASYLSSQLERSAAYKIVLSVDEPSIVDILNDAVRNHPKVSFGSYPFVSHPEYKTVVTLEGSLVDPGAAGDSASHSSTMGPRNSTLLDRSTTILSKEDRDRNVRLALDELITALPKDSILRVENDDLDPFN
jgi:FAD synthetase